MLVTMIVIGVFVMALGWVARDVDNSARGQIDQKRREQQNSGSGSDMGDGDM
ncbi:MAG TPA: hypothetical protein PKD99_17190 [Sphingopyxis sp.]|nr:hypothetical protein [Sphingopyxis sp.]HMP46835.1 hypothetical protein [Sphingopyxis sp.]HMQ20229.1 hypothetical protein [Sphingopyxis sp.]